MNLGREYPHGHRQTRMGVGEFELQMLCEYSEFCHVITRFRLDMTSLPPWDMQRSCSCRARGRILRAVQFYEASPSSFANALDLIACDTWFPLDISLGIQKLRFSLYLYFNIQILQFLWLILCLCVSHLLSSLILPSRRREGSGMSEQRTRNTDKKETAKFHDGTRWLLQAGGEAHDLSPRLQRDELLVMLAGAVSTSTREHTNWLQVSARETLEVSVNAHEDCPMPNHSKQRTNCGFELVTFACLRETQAHWTRQLTHIRECRIQPLHYFTPIVLYGCPLQESYKMGPQTGVSY